jgi:replicative DNA helicase
LGAILLDPELLWEAQSLNLTDDHFSLDGHRRIYKAMCELREGGVVPDMVTLAAYFEAHKAILSVGGMAYISDLISGVPDRPSIENYIRIVIQKSWLRTLIAVSQKAIEEAIAQQDKPEDIIGRAERGLLRLRAQGTKKAQRIGSFAGSMIQQWVKQGADKEGSTAVEFSTGFEPLDKYTTGLRRKEYSVLGGYQKDGKSSLVMQCMLANLLKGYRVLYFSHEMDKESVLKRMIAMLTLIDHFHLRDPRELTMVELHDLQSEGLLKQLQELPLYVQDASSMHIGAIEAQTRIHVRQDKIDMAFIDYLQKVNGEGQTRAEVVSGNSKRLMGLAKDEGIHVQALSQFKNPAEGRKSKPHEFSFKESGDIVGDCHVALAVYRPRDDSGYTGKDELGILLQRSGPGGIWIPAKYNTRALQWENDPERMA